MVEHWMSEAEGRGGGMQRGRELRSMEVAMSNGKVVGRAERRWTGLGTEEFHRQERNAVTLETAHRRADSIH